MQHMFRERYTHRIINIWIESFPDKLFLKLKKVECFSATQTEKIQAPILHLHDLFHSYTRRLLKHTRPSGGIYGAANYSKSK